ncbi:thioredoxin family protein [Mycobacterium kansasii]|uniref:Thioredoxin family protein n=1 Tax=Mycobacterium kansasii TaxID=1768 RepID=A0A1V3XCP7_MYCKA|nr:thioredoxin family protein [Mycobacterium kansasii]
MAVVGTAAGPTSPPAADAVELRVLNDGVFVGSSAAATTIDIFNEPICPPCGAFIRSYASDIETAVADKKLAVRYHLLNFLDDQSHTKNYSTRAVAASYCVADQNDPKVYSDFYAALFGSDFQPRKAPPPTAPTPNWHIWPRPWAPTPQRSAASSQEVTVAPPSRRRPLPARPSPRSAPMGPHSCGTARRPWICRIRAG